MKVVILASDEQKKEIKRKNTRNNVTIIFIKSILEIPGSEEYDALFLLREMLSPESFKEYSGKHVVINSVVDILANKKLPSNYSRINAWPGFLQRPCWEVATNDKNIAGAIFKALGQEIVFVKDEPGLVSARIISMIINEAYFTLGENVSTQQEIDLAMKLGTNYPAGPFEWKNTLGIQNIYSLLKELSKRDTRYLPAPFLEEEYQQYISSQKL